MLSHAACRRRGGHGGVTTGGKSPEHGASRLTIPSPMSARSRPFYGVCPVRRLGETQAISRWRYQQKVCDGHAPVVLPATASHSVHRCMLAVLVAHPSAGMCLRQRSNSHPPRWRLPWPGLKYGLKVNARSSKIPRGPSIACHTTVSAARRLLRASPPAMFVFQSCQVVWRLKVSTLPM
jgi:hypothetical protein